MNLVKTVRELLGMTQQALAIELGCTQGNVGHYERGQTVPPEVAKRLVGVAKGKGLELTLDQIYGLAPLPATPEPEKAGA